MPSPRFDSQGYNRFILRCTTSERFTPDVVMTAIDRAGIAMPFFDRVVYRYLVVGRAKQEAARMQQTYAWMDLRPEQGPGRTDTVNAFRMLLQLSPASDRRAAPVDYPSLWNQGPRAKAGGGQHWDGDNDSFRERSYTSALASGCTEDSIDIAAIERVADWISELPAARYPTPSMLRRPSRASACGTARAALTATTLEDRGPESSQRGPISASIPNATFSFRARSERLSA